MTPSISTIRDGLLEDGYFVFKQFTDREKTHKIREMVVDFFETRRPLIYDYEYDRPDSQTPQGSGAHPLGLFDPRLVDLKNLVEPGRIKELLETTFPDSAFSEAFHSDIHRNFGGVGTPMWHRDNEIRPFATVADKPFLHTNYNVYRSALYLESHDEKTALQLIPGSQKKPVDFDDKSLVTRTCDVEAGDLILFHCGIYHRSQLAKDKDRTIVFFAHGEDNFYTELHGEYVKNRLQARLGRTLEDYLSSIS